MAKTKRHQTANGQLQNTSVCARIASDRYLHTVGVSPMNEPKKPDGVGSGCQKPKVNGARSSAGEQSLHTRSVASSILAAPTTSTFRARGTEGES